MHILSGGRITGRTTELVQAWREWPDAWLLVNNRNTRERIINRYKLTEDEAKRVVPHRAFLEDNRRGLKPVELFIDDAEWLFAMLLGGEQTRLIQQAVIEGSSGHKVRWYPNKKHKCQMLGCDNLGEFDGFCVNHVPTFHGEDHEDN